MVPCALVGFWRTIWCLRGAQYPQVRCSATLALLTGMESETALKTPPGAGCASWVSGREWSPSSLHLPAREGVICSKSIPTKQTPACFVSVLFRDAVLWRQRNLFLPFSLFSWKWMLKGVVDSTFLSIFLRQVAFNFNAILRNAACQCDSLLGF